MGKRPFGHGMSLGSHDENECGRSGWRVIHICLLPNKLALLSGLERQCNIETHTLAGRMVNELQEQNCRERNTRHKLSVVNFCWLVNLVAMMVVASVAAGFGGLMLRNMIASEAAFETVAKDEGSIMSGPEPVGGGNKLAGRHLSLQSSCQPKSALLLLLSSSSSSFPFDSPDWPP